MFNPPRRFLGVTKRVGEVQEDITRVEFESGVSAGISWRLLGVGMVPIYEEHLARLERGIGMKEWYNMEPMERAIIIAVRRIDNASKGHQTEAESKKMRRESAMRGKHR